MTNTQVQNTTIFRKQQLLVTITKACPHCGAGNAPGTRSHFSTWTCHVCGKDRPADSGPYGEPLNINGHVIWERVWRSLTWWETINNFFKRIIGA